MKQQTREYQLGYGNFRDASLGFVMLIFLSSGLAACRSVSTDTPDATDRDGNAETDAETPEIGDAGMDAVSPTGSNDANTDSAKDANAVDATAEASASCRDDDECDDGLYCNGQERCVFEDDAGDEGNCVSPGNPCVDPRQCVEALDTCDCDFDGDGEISVACDNGTDCDDDGDHQNSVLCEGGEDCDDRDPDRWAGNSEVCDAEGKDEDCDPKTFRNEGRKENGIIVGAEGDVDEDGYFDVKCFNINSKTGERYGGDDCNDSDKKINPRAAEECDNIDNNCDGLTDEDRHGEEYALQDVFCKDFDGDGWGDGKKFEHFCHKPAGYAWIDPDGKFDCDDRDERKYPQNDEICDGKDNDCDGETDEPDRDGGLLFDQPSFTNTVVLCDSDAGKYYIPDGGCPPERLPCSDNVNLGCETIATTRSNCQACDTDCLFSCGDEGCDEIDRFSVGGYHVCAVTTENRAACWGRNSVGQLGIDSSRGSDIPYRVVIPKVKAIATGYFHTCAIAGEQDGLYCWGSNAHGQLGIGSGIDSSSSPIRTLGIGIESVLNDVKSIAAGTEHTCAVLNSGTVACWGNQEDGRLGNDEYDDVSIPTPLRVKDWESYDFITNGVMVVAGFAHSCLLTDDGTVKCWGDNSAGQLGVDGEVIDPALAQEVEGLSDLLDEGAEIVSLTAGLYHTCALASSNKVYCWGNNGYMQLGRPSDGSIAVPEEVDGLDDIVEIAAGNFHTCVVSASNDLTCWGGNEYGERGDDNLDSTYLPQLVEYESFDRVAAGRYVSCARTLSGQGVCWGNSLFQQLGNGQDPVEFQSVPQKISALSGSVP